MNGGKSCLNRFSARINAFGCSCNQWHLVAPAARQSLENDLLEWCDAGPERGLRTFPPLREQSCRDICSPIPVKEGGRLPIWLELNHTLSQGEETVLCNGLDDTEAKSQEIKTLKDRKPKRKRCEREGAISGETGV